MRSRRTALMGAACLMSLAACASVPTSGPVKQGDTSQDAGSLNDVSVLAREPQSGATSEQIVTGFLAANADSKEDYAVARTFLAPEIQQTWNPAAGVTEYDDTKLALKSSGAGKQIQMTAPKASTISSQGEYRPAASGAQVDQPFELKRVAGEWRIIGVRNGLLVTTNELARSYGSVNLYFFDPSGSILVPDPLLIDTDRPGVATTVVRALLKGPTTWSGASVITAFPVGTELAIDSAPVENGVVRVDLNENALKANDTERRQLSAQLVWTLTDLNGVVGVRITVRGQPYAVPSVGEVQTRTDWAAVNPDGLAAGTSGYAVADEKMVSLQGAGPVPVEGSFGAGNVTPTMTSVSLDKSTAAAVIATDPVVAQATVGTVFTSLLQPQGPPVPRITVGAVGSLSWDRTGALWVADTSVDGVVWVVPKVGSNIKVLIEGGTRVGRVQRLVVSRDGTRVAMVAGEAASPLLFVGRVVRNGAVLSVSGLRRVENRFTNVIDARWASADRLDVLTRTSSAADNQVYEVAVGAPTITPMGSKPGMSRLASAPGSPILAQAYGSIWLNAGAGWTRAFAGSAPSYPG